MPPLMTVNVNAPLAATLGVLSDIDDAVALLPGLVDLWRVDPARITRGTDNRVSAWTGVANGRQFTQVNAARQPLYVPGSRLDFGNGAAARATMLLAGTQLGQMATGTIGFRIMLDAGDETVDDQRFAGQDLDTTGTGLVRLSYRYTPATLGNYIRLVIGGSTPSNTIDADMAPSATSAMVWMSITGGVASLTANGVAASGTLAVANLNLPTFALGNAREATPYLAGGISGVCISTAVLNSAQRATAEWAMSRAAA